MRVNKVCVSCCLCFLCVYTWVEVQVSPFPLFLLGCYINMLPLTSYCMFSTAGCRLPYHVLFFLSAANSGLYIAQP